MPGHQKQTLPRYNTKITTQNKVSYTFRPPSLNKIVAPFVESVALCSTAHIADQAPPVNFRTIINRAGENMPPTLRLNSLLTALPLDSQRRLTSNLELVPLPLGKVLYESGETLRYVYFPIDCIISSIYVMESGASAGILVIGNEGMVGTAIFMGGENTPSRAIVQTGGCAYRLPVQKFKDEFNRHTDLLLLLLRYTQSLITQIAQTAACNRHHSIDQQLCRWLLLSLDRLPDNHITMTQELISNVLGVRREGVTEAAGKLQRLGVIEYSRGHITVVDRIQLEQLSCECYAVVKKETERLMPIAYPDPIPNSIYNIKLPPGS